MSRRKNLRVTKKKTAKRLSPIYEGEDEDNSIEREKINITRQPNVKVLGTKITARKPKTKKRSVFNFFTSLFTRGTRKNKNRV